MSGIFVSGTKMMKRMAAMAALLLMLTSAASAAQTGAAEIMKSTADYLKNDYEGMGVGAEWAVVGIVRADISGFDDFILSYLDNLHKELDKSDGDLGLCTEYARVVLALTSLGLDPASFRGYDLFAPLADFDKVMEQGLNGAIYALIALDSGKYNMPDGRAFAAASTREALVGYIIGQELAGGGFDDGWGGTVDMTAMALMALRPYAGDDAVDGVIERGLGVLAANQFESGTFGDWWGESGDSTAQVILALCDLGINPAADKRFLTGGKSALDGLPGFYDPGEGGFFYTYTDSESGETVKAVNAMTSEQALRALAAYMRLEAGLPAMNDMSDVALSAAAVYNAIAALPANPAPGDAAGIGAARGMYNALGRYQKLAVSNVDQLLAAEAAVAGLSETQGTPASTTAGGTPVSPKTGAAEPALPAVLLTISAAGMCAALLKRGSKI